MVTGIHTNAQLEEKERQEESSGCNDYAEFLEYTAQPRRDAMAHVEEMLRIQGW